MFFVVPFSWPSLKLSYRPVPHGKNRFMVLLNLRLLVTWKLQMGMLICGVYIFKKLFVNHFFLLFIVPFLCRKPDKSV